MYQSKDIGSLEAADALAVLNIIESIETPGSPHWSIDQVKQEIASGQSLALKNSSQVFAFILFHKLSPDRFEITYLACMQNVQRRGLMSLLFRQFLAKLREKESLPIEVWLEVHEKNETALNFYKKQGFILVGRRKNYYQDQGAAELMNLKISD